MSHNIYKAKRFIGVDDFVLPLALVADSSATAGYGRHQHHPADWVILSRFADDKALLIQKNRWNEVGEQRVRDHLEMVADYSQKNTATLDSRNFYGDTFRGNGSIRAMRSFFSARRTISVEDLVHENCGSFSIVIECYNRKTYKTIQREKIKIQTEQDIKEANKKFTNFYVSEEYVRCADINGLCIGGARYYAELL